MVEGLAENLNNLAELHIAGERLSDASALYGEAIALTRALANADPAQLTNQYRLGVYALNLGEFLTETGRKEEGLASYKEAEGLLDPLCEPADSAPDTRFAMAYLQKSLAEIELASAQYASAQARLERALKEQRAYLKMQQLATSTSEELQQQLALLGKAVLLQGHYAEAAERALELPELAPERPEARIEAAELLAGCVPLAAADGMLEEQERQAQARRFGDKAIAQLRVALDGGYRPATPLGSNPELQPLSDRDDFQNLVAELGGIGVER
jgi:tetratricopeptide (TPR) repeat protein